MERSVPTDATEERFRSLYEPGWRAVLVYLLRRGLSHDDAADVLAETFSIAWRHLEAVPTGTAALPWLYKTARGVLSNQARRQQSRERLNEHFGGELKRREIFELG